MMNPNHMWNIDEERALDIIHELLTSILLSQSEHYLQIDDLISRMNKQGKRYHIHKQKKHNCLSKYIKLKYGNIETFLGEFRFYDIKQVNHKKYVYYRGEYFDDIEKSVRFTKDREWIFV